MKYSFVFLIAFTLILVKNGETEALRVVSMDTSSGQIYVDDPSRGSSSSGILKSHLYFSYNTNSKRSLTLAAPDGYGIVAAMRMIDLRPNKLDNLTLYEVNSGKRAIFFNGLSTFHNKSYDPWESWTFDVPSGKLDVRFETGGGSSFGYDGFELIYTAYKQGFVCGYSQFHCSNRRCIASSLKCDDHNHCGDRSDQKNCNVPRRNVGGITTGVVFLIIAVALVIFIIIRRSKRSRTEVQTIISHPPPSNPTGYPPYPQPGTCYPPPPPVYTQYAQGKTNQGYH